jgi:hypothetical protein
MKPGLSRKTRNIIFYGLILVFVLVAPILIAIAYGYRFDFVKGTLGQTGGIFVKSRTPRLSIFLNSEFIKETSFLSGGALLPEVKPGTYLLRIEKEDYYPWSKTVEVEPSIVTELRNIILIPRPVTYATSTESELALLTPQNPKSPFALSKNSITQKTATTTRTLASNVYSFKVLDNTIYFVDRNGFVARFDLDTGAMETIGRPGFFLENKEVQFLKSPAGDIAIIDPAGGLFILDAARTIKFINKNVEEIIFDSQGKKALVKSGNSVKILRLGDNTFQPFEKRGAIDTILSVDTPILDAQWFYEDDAHVAVRTKEGIFFMEIDGRGGRSTIELVSGKTDGLKTLPEMLDKIFFKKRKIWQTIQL